MTVWDIQEFQKWLEEQEDIQYDTPDLIGRMWIEGVFRNLQKNLEILAVEESRKFVEYKKGGGI